VAADNKAARVAAGADKKKNGKEKSLAEKMDIKGNKKGLVLVAVLWVTVVLMVLVALLGRKSLLDTKVCLATTEGVRCYSRTQEKVITFWIFGAIMMKTLMIFC
jgi:hypothetical protein